MKTAARPSAFVAIVTVGALFLQFGACAFNSKPQKVPVTSNPAGARIIVDGQDAGTTPLSLSLKKDVDHTIQIEKPDYNPVEIRLVSKRSKSGQGLVFIPLLAGIGAAIGATGDNEEYENVTIYIGALLGALVGACVATFGSFEKARLLSPAVITVTLEKAQTQARTHVVILDRDQLKDLRWIRISCAAGGAEAVVAVN